MGIVGVLNLFAKAKIRARVGRLADEDMVRLNRAVLVFLGIAAPTNKEPTEETHGSSVLGGSWSLAGADPHPKVSTGNSAPRNLSFNAYVRASNIQSTKRPILRR
jgi:hypothetical protein